jgi:hypothetical protein
MRSLQGSGGTAVPPGKLRGPRSQSFRDSNKKRKLKVLQMREAEG